MNDAPHYVVELFGILVSLAVAIVLFLYQRQVRAGDDAAKRERDAERADLTAYKAEVHESFQALARKIEDERGRIEDLKDLVHEGQLKLAEAVKREELVAMRDEFQKSVQASTAQIIAVIQASRP